MPSMAKPAAKRPTWSKSIPRPSGEQVALIVESGSVWRDLEEIVSVRFAFVVAEGDVDCLTPLRIVWGPRVRGAFAEVDRLRPDPSVRERFRSAAWASATDAEDDGSSIASIEVVVDSRASYDFFYYLLPMALLFVLLSVRKIKARDAGPSPSA